MLNQHLLHSPNLGRGVDRPTVMEESRAEMSPFIHGAQGGWHLQAGENTARDLRAWPGQRNCLMIKMVDKVAPTTSFTLLTLSI